MADIVTGGSLLKWRVGSKVDLNVYEGQRPVFQAHNRVDSKRIANCMNVARNAVACDITIDRLIDAVRTQMAFKDEEPYATVVKDLERLQAMNDRDAI